MRFFFRSRQFRIILSVFIAVVLVAVIFGITGSYMTPGANVVSTVTAPLREAFSNVSASIGDFFASMGDSNRLALENSELKSQIDELKKQIADKDELKTQNDFYKEFLGLKEENKDFSLADASVISRDSDDPYGSFVINKGTVSGIHKYDPVITESGLVGYVTEAGLTSSKVTTVLCPDLTLGALDVRTSDSGVITGKLEFAEKGVCKLSNLSRTCSVAIGDYIKTSGEGVFPDGLLIGTVEYIGSDKYNASIFAEIKPFVDVYSVKNVMVITDFEGKGGITVGGKK